MAEKFLAVNASSDGGISIIGSECYSCWYFVTVEVEDVDNANYILTVS
jgi:hypothetical protein